MTDNKIFKPISKKIFVGKDKSKEEWTPYYTMHCYPSDNTRDNELHIWDDDFLFVQLAYGTAIDKQGFDPYEYHSFTKTEWLHMLKEARKLTEFKTFEDMYNYVLKASVGMDFNLKHTEFAIPAVIGQACLLWRHGPGALDGHQVLRQNDAAFQLRGTRVGTAAEIDGSAFCPVGLPFVGTAFPGGAIGQVAAGVAGGKPAGESDGFRVLGCKHKVVRCRFLQRGVGIPEARHVVGGGVQRVLDDTLMAVCPDDLRCMQIRTVPV